jgi:hypothetical protein
MKCNNTLSKWCKNKHGASKIIDTFETYHPCATVTFLSNQDYELSHHGTDIILSASEELFQQEKPLIGCKHPIIASGASPIGSIERTPDEDDQSIKKEMDAEIKRKR